MPTPERTLCFIPMYRCEKQIARVLARFPANAGQHIHKVLVVDNQSQDSSVQRAKEALADLHARTAIPCAVTINNENVNLGGSHKVAFNHALDHGFDYVIVLHGDDQADINDLLPRLRAGEHRAVDQLLGSRFMKGSRRVGYSWFRTFGNHVFNAVFSLCARRRLHDLGSGLNCYRVSALRDRYYLRFPNTLTFNNSMILAAVYRRASFRFFPLTWREEDQRSNVKMVRQALKTVQIPLHYLFAPRSFVEGDPEGNAQRNYASTIVAGFPTTPPPRDG